MDIKKAIKESGFTISKVAEKLGIAQPSLTAQLINGTMSLSRAKEIADIIRYARGTMQKTAVNC